MFVYDFPTLMVRLQSPAFVPALRWFFFRSTVTAVHGPAWLVRRGSPPFIQPSLLLHFPSWSLLHRSVSCGSGDKTQK